MGHSQIFPKQKSITAKLAQHASDFLRDFCKPKITDTDIRLTLGACQSGKLDVLKTMLDDGFPIEYVFDKDKQAVTPLCVAAQYGHLSLCAELIKRHANLEYQDAVQETPIFKCLARQPNADEITLTLLKLFVESGANLKQVNNIGRTLLHEASARQHDINIMEYLMSLGLDPAANDHHGNSSLHLCAAQGFNAGCTRLIKGGADPRATNREASSPLDEALKFGYLNTAVHLMAFGATADPRIRSPEGYLAVNGKKLTSIKFKHQSAEYALSHPMHHAAYKNKVDSLHCFLQNGFDPEAQDSLKRTVLEVAQSAHPQGDCTFILRTLLARNAAVDILNEINQSAAAAIKIKA